MITARFVCAMHVRTHYAMHALTSKERCGLKASVTSHADRYFLVTLVILASPVAHHENTCRRKPYPALRFCFLLCGTELAALFVRACATSRICGTRIPR